MVAVNERRGAVDTSCPVCGSTEFGTVDLPVRHAAGVAIHICGECELVYLWPQPDAATLAAFYTAEYRDVYEDPTPAERHEQDLPEARLRATRITPLVNGDERLLEIGSGSFAFLKTIAPTVGFSLGIEPDDKTRAWFAEASDLRTLPDIGALTAEDGHFDLIVMFHVLEHLPDPVGYLSYLRGLLSPGGHIVVEVPNANDALISLYNIEAFRRFYYSIAHLTYFNPTSLDHCARAAGLTGKVTGVQRYDLSNHLHWAQHGRPGGQAVYTDTISAATNNAYARDLINAGKADTLWGVFQVDGPAG
ncbi:MAG: class I SAM-dependent methyltransferase [Rhodospirillales bacterium]